jgi:hypothetical protein
LNYNAAKSKEWNLFLVARTAKKLSEFYRNLYRIALFATVETNNFPGSKTYREFRGEKSISVLFSASEDN